jgi:hypothetical protein
MRWSCLRQTLGAGGRLGASLACGGSWSPASTTPAGPDALLDVSSYPDDIRKCGGKNAIVGQPTGHRKIREWSLNVRIALSSVVVLSLASISNAQSPNCRRFKDEKQRMQCLDAQSKAKILSSPAGLAAKAAIAKQLRDPTSTLFSDVEETTTADGTRAICRSVKVKNKRGEYEGGRPFVYVIDTKQGYLLTSGGAGEGLLAFEKYCSGQPTPR